MFAAPNIVTGQVTGLCPPRHRNQELLPLLRQVARAHPFTWTRNGDQNLTKASRK